MQGYESARRGSIKDRKGGGLKDACGSGILQSRVQHFIHGHIDCEVATFENECIFQITLHVFVYFVEF